MPSLPASSPSPLAVMNLALHSIDTDFGPENADAFHRDLDPALRPDSVIANSPFNADAADKERLKDMVGRVRTLLFSLPRTDNAN